MVLDFAFELYPEGSGEHMKNCEVLWCSIWEAGEELNRGQSMLYDPELALWQRSVDLSECSGWIKCV